MLWAAQPSLVPLYIHYINIYCMINKYMLRATQPNLAHLYVHYTYVYII